MTPNRQDSGVPLFQQSLISLRAHLVYCFVEELTDVKSSTNKPKSINEN